MVRTLLEVLSEVPMNSPWLELLLVCIGAICVLWLIYSLTLFLTGVYITADEQETRKDKAGADDDLPVCPPVRMRDLVSIEGQSRRLRHGVWSIDHRTAELAHLADEAAYTQHEHARRSWSAIQPASTCSTGSGRVLHHFGPQPLRGGRVKEREL
jgi:hypothetical protein